MIKTCLILISFIAFSLCLNAQIIDKTSIECQYKLTWVPDTLRPNQTKEDFMILKVGHKLSEFYSYNTFRVDSMIQVDVKNGMSSLQILAQRAKYGKKGMEYQIYKNYPEGKITVIEKLMSDSYKYEEILKLQKWAIENEKKTILGYNAQKATCSFGGRKYTAWFTTEIPVSTGPWKFSGLPGLILKVEDNNKNYVFEIAGLRKIKKDEPISLEQKEYIELTKTDFFKLDKKMKKDPLAFMNSNTSVTLKPSGNNQKKERPYNPIEH
ncbi:GLPGLI family protein [Pedobacter cryoconitis]|uniref:GLPGLI family protein n=1 Tax=Pedobacter cryoconitis TaxID=188932 RepID=A0A327SK52_9SPHI|nr:GLPGLI family protein [Pedobacter cryoconitis]RAJ29566.1 GLPGLI family protein [Pedobacter cryoconitis]